MKQSFDQFAQKHKAEEQKQSEVPQPFKGAVINPNSKVAGKDADKNGKKTNAKEEEEESSEEEDDYENFAWFKATKQIQNKMEDDTYIAFYNDI